MELRQEMITIRPGDVVRTGPNLFPFYTVIAVSGEKVWIRDTQTDEDYLVSAARCRTTNSH